MEQDGTLALWIQELREKDRLGWLQEIDLGKSMMLFAQQTFQFLIARPLPAFNVASRAASCQSDQHWAGEGGVTRNNFFIRLKLQNFARTTLNDAHTATI